MVVLSDDGKLSQAPSDSCKSQFTTFKVTQNSPPNFYYIISTRVSKSSFDLLLNDNISLRRAAAMALMTVTPTCNLSGVEVNILLTLSVSQPELLNGCRAKRLELEPKRLEPKDRNCGCKDESLEQCK
jgi:hypothetical protein